MSKLLINEPPLQVLPSLANLIGLNEAIFVQQLHYWIINPNCAGKTLKGKKYVRNTVQEWIDGNFPFYSASTIRRIVKNTKKQGIVLTTSRLNKERYDKTLWYTIDYEALDRLVKMTNGIDTPTGQNDNRVSMAPTGQNDHTNTRDYNNEESAEKKPSSPKSGDGDEPKPKKKKSEYALRSEAMEIAFANARGCAPLTELDWEQRAAELQKRWRTPLNAMLKMAGNDLTTAISGIFVVVQTLIDKEFVFSAPDQIKRTYESWIIDYKNGRTGAWSAPPADEPTEDDQEAMTSAVLKARKNGSTRGAK